MSLASVNVCNPSVHTTAILIYHWTHKREFRTILANHKYKEHKAYMIIMILTKRLH